MATFTDHPPRPPLFVIEEHEYPTHHKTVVVLGLPNSGTSATAAVIDALGIPIVRDEGIPNFEHSKIVYTRPQETAEFVRECDSRLDVWGFKNPHMLAFHIGWFTANIRNPFYVIVTKDVTSICVRSQQAALDDPRQPFVSSRECFRYQSQRTMQFLAWVGEFCQAPIAALGYYELLRQPVLACEQLRQFLQTPLDDAELQKAIRRIATDGGYLVSD